jgi:hypothetical protein
MVAVVVRSQDHLDKTLAINISKEQVLVKHHHFLELVLDQLLPLMVAVTVQVLIMITALTMEIQDLELLVVAHLDIQTEVIAQVLVETNTLEEAKAVHSIMLVAVAVQEDREQTQQIDQTVVLEQEAQF